MVKHIVLWKLREHAVGKTKLQNAEKAKEMYEAMIGKIPGLLKMEVGIDISHSDSSADLSLYSEFESENAYGKYLTAPEHMAVVPFMQAIREERQIVDYV